MFLAELGLGPSRTVLGSGPTRQTLALRAGVA
jgi:hypothetical protein